MRPLLILSLVSLAITSTSLFALAAPPSLTAQQKASLRSLGIKIAVPASVPSGFRIDKVQVEPCRAGTPRSSTGVCRFGPAYGIVYRNPNNVCFAIEATGGGVGGPAFDYAFPVNTKLFGQTSLQFGQQSVAVPKTPSAQQLATPQKNLFMDWGGVGPFYRLIGADFTRTTYYGERDKPVAACRKDITPNEAVKIIQSLEWLK